MKIPVAVGALLVFASYLYSQGLNPPPGRQTRIGKRLILNSNSSVLTDGYPSLLRLAELLGQHRDYKVRIVGHADSVGSAAYNNRLSSARANTVRDFLIKYGASADQITTAGEGKANPAVGGNTREARFINRRVVLTVTNAQGQIIKGRRYQRRFESGSGPQRQTGAVLQRDFAASRPAGRHSRGG
jgi:hypothetical protein